jgi:hypothetical protein
VSSRHGDGRRTAGAGCRDVGGVGLGDSVTLASHGGGAGRAASAASAATRLFWVGFGRTRSAPATGGTGASWACSERVATRPLRAGTRRGRARLARQAPGSLRAASRDDREAAARRACWPRSWAAAGRGLAGEEEWRDEGLQGRSERIRWERENGERERGRGELTSTMAMRAGCSEVGERKLTTAVARRVGIDHGAARCEEVLRNGVDGREHDEVATRSRRGRGRENWASGEKSVRLARKICAAGGSGKTNSGLLRPGAWAPLGSGGGRRSTRCVRATHAWTCGWPRSCGLGWGVALAGLARVGWPRRGAGSHGARGPTREELARWAERGEGMLGRPRWAREERWAEFYFSFYCSFLSLFYLFQFDIICK